MNYSMTKVNIIVGTVIGMIVRCEQMNVETFKVNLTNSQSLASKPVSMKQFVRIAIEAKLMEGAVIDSHFGEDGRSRTNDAIVKVMTVG